MRRPGANGAGVLWMNIRSLTGFAYGLEAMLKTRVYAPSAGGLSRAVAVRSYGLNSCSAAAFRISTLESTVSAVLVPLAKLVSLKAKSSPPTVRKSS